MRARVFKRGEVWYLDYRDPSTGRRLRPATTARTKGEANLLLAEKLTQFTRVKLGLDEAPALSSLTFWELCDWWIEHICPERSRDIQRYQLGRHVQKSMLGVLPCSKVTPEVLETHYQQMEKEGYAPATINKVRNMMNTVFATARKKAHRKYTGPNPVLDTEPRTVHKKRRPVLLFEEVERFLAQVPEAWRGFFSVAIYLGLRKGEIASLRRKAVNLRTRELSVETSWEFSAVKQGDFDNLPIVPQLVPYLKEAMKGGSEYVFLSASGKPYSRDCNPEKICRTALKNAGIVDGYEHSCRRCGHARRVKKDGVWSAEPVPSPHPEYRKTYEDAELRRCPQCKMKLWAEPIPRGNMRFHDLRHSVGTILLRAGAKMHEVQKVLRHARIETTSSIYSHLDTEDNRKVLESVWGKSAVAAAIEARRRDEEERSRAAADEVVENIWSAKSSPERVRAEEAAQRPVPSATPEAAGPGTNRAQSLAGGLTSEEES